MSRRAIFAAIIVWFCFSRQSKAQCTLSMECDRNSGVPSRSQSYSDESSCRADEARGNREFPACSYSCSCVSQSPAPQSYSQPSGPDPARIEAERREEAERQAESERRREEAEERFRKARDTAAAALKGVSTSESGLKGSSPAASGLKGLNTTAAPALKGLGPTPAAAPKTALEPEPVHAEPFDWDLARRKQRRLTELSDKGLRRTSQENEELRRLEAEVRALWVKVMSASYLTTQEREHLRIMFFMAPSAPVRWSYEDFLRRVKKKVETPEEKRRITEQDIWAAAQLAQKGAILGKTIQMAAPGTSDTWLISSAVGPTVGLGKLVQAYTQQTMDDSLEAAR